KRSRESPSLKSYRGRGDVEDRRASAMPRDSRTIGWKSTDPDAIWSGGAGGSGKPGRLGRAHAVHGRESVGHAISAHRLITLVIRRGAGQPLLLDVGDFPVRAHLAVMARNAPAAECRETEKADQTHRRTPLIENASGVPIFTDETWLRLRQFHRRF